jgi:hypothetical protein
LHALLTRRAARGALVFTCNGRGRRLFGTPDHDAIVVGDLLGTSAVAGCSVPESSGQSAAATPSTDSPRRSPASRRHRWHQAAWAIAAERSTLPCPSIDQRVAGTTRLDTLGPCGASTGGARIVDSCVAGAEFGPSADADPVGAVPAAGVIDETRLTERTATTASGDRHRLNERRIANPHQTCASNRP